MVNAAHRPEELATVIERPATQKVSDASLRETLDKDQNDVGWVDLSDSKIPLEEFETRYARKEVLARGGMSEVELLYDLRVGREIAAKFLDPAYCGKSDSRARFVREACLQGQLEHPSIVPVHEVGVAPNGQPYFTMKRIRGMTLREVLMRIEDRDPAVVNKFSRRKLLGTFNNVCLTVAFAHENNVVHRDLKPANIMLGDFGETYVLDWGLAKRMGAPEPATDDSPHDNVIPTRAGAIFGTPGYMAPEQIGGSPETLGPRADVYALGAILFEILTLQPLHGPSNDRDDLIRSTLEGAEAHASKRCPDADVPPELEAICVKATAFIPAERYASVREMCDAIERYLDGDRDLEVRCELASAHAESAESSLRRAYAAPVKDEQRHRSRAMAEVGRALALDVKNARANDVLMRLLLDPPRVMPAEAREELARMSDRSQRYAERWGAVAYGSCIICIPALLWMGVRSPLFLSAVAASVIMLSAISLAASFVKQKPRWVPYVRLTLAVLAISFSTRMFGPLLMAPALLLANLVSFSLNPSRTLRWYGMAVSCLGLLVPLILESTGTMSQSYAFAGGMMCILPNVVELRPGPTLHWLVLSSCGLLVLGAGFVGRIRNQLRAMEEHFHLYTWHLKQLVPREVRTDPRLGKTKTAVL